MLGRRFLLALAALLLLTLPAIAQQAGPAPKPNFAAYPAEPALRGKPKQPDFAGRDAAFAEFRTRLTAAARKTANFSSHYVITQIGCGTGCNTAYVIDKATGAVTVFPRGGATHAELDLKHNARSALVVASWRSTTDDKCWTEQFVLRAGKFELLGGTYRSGAACFE
jgi:hypothetical protein